MTDGFEVKESVLNVLFRCDGSPQIGLGHLVRCLALADELAESKGCNIVFAIRESELGKGIAGKKYPIITPPDNSRNFDYEHWMLNSVRSTKADVLVLDVRDGLKPSILNEIKTKNVLIVDIDDPEEKRLAADLAFYPPVPQVNRMDWTGFNGKLFTGWDWVLLRKEFSQNPDVERNNSLFKILITMGGSDPQGMTIKAVKAMDKLDEDFDAISVLGSGFQHKEALDKVLSDCKHRFDVRKNVTNMAKLMAGCDFAVASFGVTAYELASRGVPAAYLCLTKDHLESAGMFVDQHLAYGAWLYHDIEANYLANLIRQNIKDNYLKKQMDKMDRLLIDGQGAKRIVDQIVTSRFKEC